MVHILLVTGWLQMQRFILRVSSREQLILLAGKLKVMRQQVHFSVPDVTRVQVHRVNISFERRLLVAPVGPLPVPVEVVRTCSKLIYLKLCLKGTRKDVSKFCLSINQGPFKAPIKTQPCDIRHIIFGIWLLKNGWGSLKTKSPPNTASHPNPSLEPSSWFLSWAVLTHH